MMTTDRCPHTDKVPYPSEAAAVRALHSIEDAGRDGQAPLHAYPCAKAPHWHVGHRGRTRDRKKPRPPRRRNKETRPTTFNRVEWDEASMTLWARCRDRCEWCGDPLQGDAARHHRQRRGVGGDRLSNLVLLHTRCHRHVHDHPQQATALGFIVSSYDADPAAVPIRIDGYLWTLTDRGARKVLP